MISGEEPATAQSVSHQRRERIREQRRRDSGAVDTRQQSCRFDWRANRP
jgi:hypothetical protein